MTKVFLLARRMHMLLKPTRTIVLSNECMGSSYTSIPPSQLASRRKYAAAMYVGLRGIGNTSASTAKVSYRFRRFCLIQCERGFIIRFFFLLGDLRFLLRSNL